MTTITEIYRQLFGKGGLKDGTVIEMSEHGRAGGVSTGTPFKSVQEIPNKFVVDEANSTTTYIGEAAPATDTSSAAWRIRKISVSGTVTTIEFADGNDKFDNVWDSRASLSYS